MISGALAFLGGNWQRLVIYGLVIVGALGTAAGIGFHYGVLEKYEYIAEQAKEAVKVVFKVTELIREVTIENTKTEIKIERVFYKIEEETEDAPSRSACNATRGWVRRHNAAVDGEDGPDPGDLDETTDTDIRENVAQLVVVRNYKAFHQVANDLRSCRAFVTGVAKITGEAPP
jgi:hypothetical protein